MTSVLCCISSGVLAYVISLFILFISTLLGDDSIGQILERNPRYEKELLARNCPLNNKAKIFKLPSERPF